MRLLFIATQVLIVFAFVCHSYIIITPVLDELGFFRVAIHILMVSLCWGLYLVARDINREENKNRKRKRINEQKSKGENNEI